MHKKKGDTLIEVALAIGIFSLVAIIIVSVITASTSGAQSSLEVTLAREEMDVQAEAIRFIHDGYSSGSQSAAAKDGENPYANLWNALLKGTDTAYSRSNTIVASKPTTCAELYDSSRGLLNSNYGTNVFVINTRRLSNPSDIDNIVIKNTPSGSLFGYNPTGNARGPFYAPSTYPRIIYGSRADATAKDDLLDQVTDTYNNIRRVEGLFVVPVRGTSKVPLYGISASEEIPYYDFYISACWMAPGSDRASTLGSIVRLYDYLGSGTVKVTYDYVPYNSRDTHTSADYPMQTGKRVVLRKIEAPLGWTVMWKDKLTGKTYSADGLTAVINTDPNKAVMEYVMTPVWTHTQYKITYKANHPYSNYADREQICYLDETCTLYSNSYSANNYKNLRKWCPGTTDNLNGGCNVTSYDFGQTFSPSGTRLPTGMFNSVSHTVTLRGMWEMAYTIVYDINSPYADNSTTIPNQTCYRSDTCRLTTTQPNASGYRFQGWCLGGSVNNVSGTCSGTFFRAGSSSSLNYLFDTYKYSHVITLKGVWKENNETYKIVLEWSQGNPYRDLDSHIVGKKADGSSFHSYYGNKTYSESGRNIAELDRDCVSNCDVETFIINTLGGRTFYYYVVNFSEKTESITHNAYVYVYRMNDYGNYNYVRSFSASDAYGWGGVWNVFALRDGNIISRQHRAAAPEENY